ncbi:hypothetical protein HK102_006947 [Quaeritorhiza haematococci]|nr:hypothetical protein HK102_006947 [Quaeritorhiza haematococci]
MADGTAAGLQTGKSLRRDLESRKRERDEAFKRIDSSLTGKGAATIYRDKFGKKVDIAAQRAEEAAKKRKEEAEEEARMEWGKGIKQKQDAEEMARRLAEERAMPLAIYKDDRRLNEELMDRDRWGDPMAFMAKKKKKGGKEYPQYKGPWPPNRFNVRPGYRWDGVDRSNGFEAQYFQQQNAKMAMAEEAYKWSTEDM